MSRPPGRVALARMWRGGGHSLAKPWEDAMLTAADVMTTDVVTVVPETPVRDIARLLHTKRISGVPVVSPDNRVIGIVSEGDLIGVASENSIHLTRSHRRIRTRSSDDCNRPLVRPYAVRLLQAATAAGSRNPNTAASAQRPAAAHAAPSAAFALGRPRPVHLALSSLSPHSGCNEHRQARDRVRSKNRNCRKDSEFSIPGVASAGRAG